MHPVLSIPEPECSTGNLHLRAVERVIEVLRKPSDQPLTLEKMSRIALISPYHFVRVFHRLTGLPPVRYQWITRLAYAKRLLVETSLSVIEVCFEAGYNSLGSFTRRFTSLVGMPPHHFRLSTQDFDHDRFSRLMLAVRECEPLPCSGGITGDVKAPPGFDGLIFVGFFPDRQDRSRPSACCALAGPGRFQVSSIPDGRYRMEVTAVPRFARAGEYFVHDNALRASPHAGPVTINSGRIASGDTSLTLRPPRLLDPPILLALVLLLESKLQSLHVRTHAVEPIAVRARMDGLHAVSSTANRIRAASGD